MGGLACIKDLCKQVCIHIFIKFVYIVSIVSCVISLRIPKSLRKALDELGVDWREEVRGYLKELVRRRKRQALLEMAGKLRKSIGAEGTEASMLIREDRDGR